MSDGQLGALGLFSEFWIAFAVALVLWFGRRRTDCARQTYGDGVLGGSFSEGAGFIAENRRRCQCWPCRTLRVRSIPLGTSVSVRTEGFVFREGGGRLSFQWATIGQRYVSQSVPTRVLGHLMPVKEHDDLVRVFAYNFQLS